MPVQADFLHHFVVLAAFKYALYHHDENDDVDVLIVLMVLTRGKSGVNICRARVAETGELEETPILLEVPPGTIQYIILYLTLLYILH